MKLRLRSSGAILQISGLLCFSVATVEKGRFRKAQALLRINDAAVSYFRHPTRLNLLGKATVPAPATVSASSHMGFHVVTYGFRSSPWCPKGHYLGRCTVCLGTSAHRSCFDLSKGDQQPDGRVAHNSEASKTSLVSI
jgi:hypothetical protein